MEPPSAGDPHEAAPTSYQGGDAAAVTPGTVPKGLWGGPRQTAVALAAACGTALLRSGWAGLAVWMARLLLALGLRRFLGDVVALAVAQGQAAALGVLCIAASQRGAPKLAQHLLKELLDQRHVAAAAAMAEACWHVAAATGRRPHSAAALLAPALVSAADGGSAGAAAAMLQLLFAAHMQALIMWLLESIVRGAGRADAAAAVAWQAMQAGGAVMVGDCWALLAMDGHHQSAAELAAALFETQPSTANQKQAAAVLAAGMQGSAEAGQEAEDVAVLEELYCQDRLVLLAAMVAALAGQHRGPRCAALILQHAISSGRDQLVAAIIQHLLQLGAAEEAAALLEALHTSGHQRHVTRVAAAAVVDAVDERALEAVAVAHALLWRRSCLPLLRDVWMTALREGWENALAAVAWQVLRQGGDGGKMVADLLAAVVGLQQGGAASLVAPLVLQLAGLSACSPMVVEAVGEALMTAVHEGHTVQASSLVAQLSEEGSEELIGRMGKHLSGTGRGEEFQRLLPAAEHSTEQ